MDFNLITKINSQPKIRRKVIAFLLILNLLIMTNTAFALVRYAPSATISTGDITSSHILDGEIVSADLDTTNGFFLDAKLGIGTSTPYSQLTVWSATTTADRFVDFIDTASTSIMYITDGGQVVINTGGSASAPTLAFGDANTGFYESADNTMRLAITGVARAIFSGNSITSEVSQGYALYNETATALNPTVTPNKGDNDTGIGHAMGNHLSLIAGGVEAMRLSSATSTVPDAFGVGTSTPAEKLSVEGKIYATEGIMFGDGSSQTVARQGLGANVSETLQASADTEENTTNTSFTKFKEFIVNRSGTIRTKFDLKEPLGSQTVHGRVYVDGEAFGTDHSTTSASYVNFTDDITIGLGQRVQLYIYTEGAGNAVYTRNFRLYWTDVVASSTITVNP